MPPVPLRRLLHKNTQHISSIDLTHTQPTNQPHHTQPSDTAPLLATFTRALRLPCGGALLVRPLAPTELAPAAAVLTASFAESMGYPPAARGVLARHIEAYLARHANLLPAAAVLGATLVPACDARAGDLAALEAAATRGGGGECEDDDDSSPYTSYHVPPAGDAALVAAGGGFVASAELSFDASTRSRALGGLDPPRREPGTAYLCNMAVAADARGKGVGAALLDAAHDAAAVGGASRVYLHLRLTDADGPAGRLYGRAGYAEVGRDAPLVRVFGRDRRCLLVRDV